MKRRGDERKNDVIFSLIIRPYHITNGTMEELFNEIEQCMELLNIGNKELNDDKASFHFTFKAQYDHHLSSICTIKLYIEKSIWILYWMPVKKN